MASNYAKILELANKNNMGLSNTIKRDYGIPLDYSSVHETYEAALAYAQTNTLAYVGQPISVGDTLYIVTGKSGTEALKAVGSKPAGDNSSIVVAEDGTVSIKGFAAAEDAYLPRVRVTDAGRELEWVPASSFVSPDRNTRSVVTTPEGSAITVTPTHDAANDIYTYTLDVTFPADPVYNVVKTTNADGATVYRLTKDGANVSEEIVVPKAYDDTELSGAVTALENTVSGHTTSIQEVKTKVDAFFAAVEQPDEIIDTLAEIQSYIANDKTGASGMLESIQQNTQAIETLNGDASTEGSVDKKIATAISAHETAADGKYATGAALAEVKSTADAAASKTYVDTQLAQKADASALSNYATIENTYDRTTIDNKIKELVGTDFDPDLTVTSLDAKINDHITESDSQFAAIETKQGTQDTAIQANTDEIAAIKDEQTGIKAQAVAAAKTETQTQVKALADGQVATNTQNIADLQADLTATKSTVTGLSSSINGENGLANRVGALEEADTALTVRVAANEGSVKSLSTTTAANTQEISGLKTAVEEAESAISALDGKFSSYSTTDEMNTAIATAISGVDKDGLAKQIQDNADAIAAEVTRSTEEDTRISNLVNGISESVSGHSGRLDTAEGQIAALNALLQDVIDDKDGTGLDSIKELAAWIETHGTDAAEMVADIGANTAAIAKLNGTADVDGSVLNIVNAAIANIPATPIATSSTVGVVKGSSHISVEADGSMVINQDVLSTDNIKQGVNTLVLNGGTSAVNI